MRLKKEYREETVIEKSRFIAIVKPCFNEDEARSFIDQIRHEFPDSSHVCTAYVIGEGNRIRRSSDNKEPSGTAGVPMLNSILSSNLENTCACVVRYFGGIKLGTGGLARAYGGCVKNALEHAEKCEDIPVDVYELSYPYELSGTMESWLRRNGTISDVLYDDAVHCIFETEMKDSEKKIQDLSKGKCTVSYLHQTKKEKDL
ncbi:MAG: YigZ family protein [Bulleidia sp.]|nr:YigZ family protein [Bulleidia sp.]